MRKNTMTIAAVLAAGMALQGASAVMAVPAVGVLCGIIFLGEPMTMSIALGMVILFAGILIVLGLGEKKS